MSQISGNTICWQIHSQRDFKAELFDLLRFVTFLLPVGFVFPKFQIDFGLNPNRSGNSKTTEMAFASASSAWRLIRIVFAYGKLCLNTTSRSKGNSRSDPNQQPDSNYISDNVELNWRSCDWIETWIYNSIETLFGRLEDHFHSFVRANETLRARLTKLLLCRARSWTFIENAFRHNSTLKCTFVNTAYRSHSSVGSGAFLRALSDVRISASCIRRLNWVHSNTIHFETADKNCVALNSPNLSNIKFSWHFLNCSLPTRGALRKSVALCLRVTFWANLDYFFCLRPGGERSARAGVDGAIGITVRVSAERCQIMACTWLSIGVPETVPQLVSVS